MNVEIIASDLCFAHDLAPRLRQQDKDEVFASSGMSPLEALTASVNFSDEDMSWTALVDGVPEVMWGCGGCGDEYGIPWLLGSDRVMDIKSIFYQTSVKHTKVMHERYPILTNFVHTANTVSMKWLQSLGYKPMEFVPQYGHTKSPFIRYQSNV